MIDAHRIVYNNLSSDEFDVTPHFSFSGEDGTVSSFLSREGVYTEHYDGHRTIHRVKNNEVFTPRFTLMKKDFSDIDPTENRRILSWLTASDKPGWFEVYRDDSNVLEWRVFGYVAPIEQYKLGSGRIVGYEFEVESSHPYAWSRKFVYPEKYDSLDEIGNNDENNDYLVIDGTHNFTITCNSDEYNKPLYPKVTITFKGENKYFPIKVNPIQENTYPMVPNVIYSWTEYILATKYAENVTYYSDMNGTKALPQPTSDEEIKSGIYYTGTEHLFVSLNGVEHNGRYEIQVVDSKTVASSGTKTPKYYYFTDKNVISTTVSTIDENENVSYHWEQVAIIGRAARVSNTYISDGKPATKEAIIAGGADGEVIVLNGANKVISGTKGTTTRIIGDDFNWEWIPFVYGENNISVSGNCHIKFEWLEPRKVGSL